MERTIRINKVLRELNISLDRAVTFLSFHNISIESNPNAKISDYEYELLLKQFAGGVRKSLMTNVELLEESLKVTLEKSETVAGSSNTYILNGEGKICKLNISNGIISKLTFLNNLTELEELYMHDNDITEITPISNLQNLKILDLSHNRIKDLEPLKSLKNLTHLNLSNNQISFVKKYHLPETLIHLNLISNELGKIDFIDGLPILRKLYAGDNKISKVSISITLPSLENLELNRNFIRDISFLDYLPNLKSFSLESNKIESLAVGANFPRLSFLNVKDNTISNIDSLKTITSLKNVELSGNDLQDISVLQFLTRLKDLRIGHNNITDITALQPLVKRLAYLDIIDNPICETEGWKIDNNTFQLGLVREYFSRIDNEQINYRMPVKVLLLGNHASGKSTFLDHLLSEDKGLLRPHKNSTHIIRVESYPKKRSKKELPEIIYYDFGGQDYYHGIYKAFLTNDSINIILWNVFNNKNQLRYDSHGELTRDFTKEYWIGQLAHFLEISNERLVEGSTFLVQTQADSDKSKKINLAANHYTQYGFDEFYISLDSTSVRKSRVLKIALDLLCASLEEQIEQKRTYVDRPKWYGSFINFVLNSTDAKATELDVISKEYKREIKEGETKSDIREYLKNELDQLHKQGLILYYKDSLPNIAWLNPTATTKHIHDDILKKVLTNQNGVIDKKILEENADNAVIKLLLMQHVIYFDLKSKKYLIPNFLKLVSDSHEANYKMITFGLQKPEFVIKSKSFLPFGIVNQLISHFGKYDDTKYFWRDQLIFTLKQKVKVLIKLNFDSLEISVHFHYLTNEEHEKAQLTKYIFSCILAVYWNTALIGYDTFIDGGNNGVGGNNAEEKNAAATTFKQKQLIDKIDRFQNLSKRFPDDFYISVDDEYFVEAKRLVSEDIEREFTISASKIIEVEEKIINLDGHSKIVKRRYLDSNVTRELPIYLFQSFVKYKTKKMKKIFVSYSHANTDEMKELKKFLNSFERNREIEKWTDLEINAGVKVKDEILKNLNNADIVILLISQDFIASDFIYDNELQLAMKKKLQGTSEIVPIVLSESTIFDLQLDVKYDGDDIEKVKMGEYYFIPQDSQNNLKPINKWALKDEAWMAVYRHLKKIISS